jgi:hypothetical protein
VQQGNHFAGAHDIMGLAAKAIKQPTYHKFQSCHFFMLEYNGLYLHDIHTKMSAKGLMTK